LAYREGNRSGHRVQKRRPAHCCFRRCL